MALTARGSTHGGSLGASGNAPRLLQQMTMLMGSWRPEPPEGTEAPDGATAWERRMANEATAESVLKLYTASAGVYEPLLRQLHDFQASLIDDLYDELRATRSSASVFESRLAARSGIAGGGTDPTTADGESSRPGSVPDAAEVADRCDYAFSRVSAAEKRMAKVVEEAKRHRDESERTIAGLEAEVENLKEQLQDQINKYRSLAAKDAGEVDKRDVDLDRDRYILTLERRLAEERIEVSKLKEEVGRREERIHDLLDLNGRYARQALEIAARVRVYAEHNDKFATLFSLQLNEKVNLEEENKMLRQHNLDLNRFQQLRDDLEGEGGTVSQAIDVRSIRYGRGVNPSVPRHLHFSGLMNRVPMPKESAAKLVAEILKHRQTRSSQSKEFGQFLHEFFLRRNEHSERNAIPWAYSLDEASRFYDSDVNLNLFGLVSRREVPEALYKDINLDQHIFIEGCEIMDQLQHGTVNFTIPVPHIVGLLVEMYPGYSDGAFRRIIDNLNATLTSHGRAHYRMLFPNMELDELSTPELAQGLDLRKENHFSQAFKELLVDDCVVSLQQIEDEVHRLPGDKVSLSDVRDIATKLFPTESVAREVHLMLRRIVLDHHGASGKYAVSMPKSQFVLLLRTRAPVRKGVFRSGSTFSNSAQRVQPLMELAAGKGDTRAAVMQNLTRIDYRNVLQSVTTKRTSYVTAEDLRMEEEERLRQQALAATAENAEADGEGEAAEGANAAEGSKPAAPVPTPPQQDHAPHARPAGATPTPAKR